MGKSKKTKFEEKFRSVLMGPEGNQEVVLMQDYTLGEKDSQQLVELFEAMPLWDKEGNIKNQRAIEPGYEMELLIIAVQTVLASNVEGFDWVIKPKDYQALEVHSVGEPYRQLSWYFWVGGRKYFGFTFNLHTQ